MTGTLLNAAAILAGSVIGVLAGNRLSDRWKGTLLSILGLCTFGFGLQMFLRTSNALVVVTSLLIGAAIGEGADIDGRLHAWLRRTPAGGDSAAATPDRNPVRAFLTASLLFCVGPMTILGSFQDGLSGDYRLLMLKSVLDGVSAVALSSALGAGVAASAVLVLLLQGSLSIAAGWLQPLLTDAMLTEFTAAGGVLLMGIAVSDLLRIHPIRSANWLPAVFLAPLGVAMSDILRTWIGMYQ